MFQENFATHDDDMDDDDDDDDGDYDDEGNIVLGDGEDDDRTPDDIFSRTYHGHLASHFWSKGLPLEKEALLVNPQQIAPYLSLATLPTAVHESTPLAIMESTIDPYLATGGKGCAAVAANKSGDNCCGGISGRLCWDFSSKPNLCADTNKAMSNCEKNRRSARCRLQLP